MSNHKIFNKLFLTGYFFFFGLALIVFLLPKEAKAVLPNIVPDTLPNGPFTQWAWNDVIGWIDFLITGTPNVIVADAELSGYASSSVGYLALNCGSGLPPGGFPDCMSLGNWKVSNGANGVAGRLSGWAWNDQIGWISFCGNTSGGSMWINNRWECPANPTYQVTIITSATAGLNPGDFFGWAWNDVIGWISFNCSNVSCGLSNYKVKTSWVALPPTLTDGNLVSSIFDTCPSGTLPNTSCGSSAPNTIMWRGSLPANTAVRFQIASSDCENGGINPPTCSGLWSLINNGTCDPATASCFHGPSSIVSESNNIGVLGGYYQPPDQNQPLTINQLHHLNKRYLRYRVYLKICNPPNPSCPISPTTPRIDDIIINWSP